MTGVTRGPTLREQLGGSPDPDFELQLLPGWERRSPDDGDRERLEAAMKARFMSIQRPDLHAYARDLLRESYQAMQKEGAVAFYAATAQADDTIWIPGSIIVSVRRPPAGATLDDLVRHAIREYDAAPLFDDKRFVRFEREKTLTLEDTQVLQTSIVYLTPIPGAKRRRALQFTAAFGRSPGVPSDDKRIAMYKSAFDLVISTLRWHMPERS